MRPFELRVSPDVVLRLATLADAPALYAFVERNRAGLELWLSWAERVRDVDGARTFIERYAKRWRRQVGLLVGIWWGETLAGCAVYREIDAINHYVEIGYALDEAFRGRGLATAVTRALTDHAFDALDMNRVLIVCATDNLPSRAIPERLGFRHEGTAREAAVVRGQYVDLERYAILRREWQALAAAGETSKQPGDQRPDSSTTDGTNEPSQTTHGDLLYNGGTSG